MNKLNAYGSNQNLTMCCTVPNMHLVSSCTLESVSPIWLVYRGFEITGLSHWQRNNSWSKLELEIPTTSSFYQK